MVGNKVAKSQTIYQNYYLLGESFQSTGAEQNSPPIQETFDPLASLFPSNVTLARSNPSLIADTAEPRAKRAAPLDKGMPHKAKMRQSRLAAYPDIGSEPVEYM
jgi:hypothetical protein